MLDPLLSDNHFKNKIAQVGTTLKVLKLPISVENDKFRSHLRFKIAISGSMMNTYTGGLCILFTIIGKSGIEDHGNNEKEHQETQFPQGCWHCFNQSVKISWMSRQFRNSNNSGQSQHSQNHQECCFVWKIFFCFTIFIKTWLDFDFIPNKQPAIVHR